MTTANTDFPIETLCVDCNKLKHTLHIELVDEFDEPVGDIAYTIKGRFGERQGTVTSDGVIEEKELPAGPLRLTLEAQPLADEMEQRKLRIDRDVSTVKARAEKEQAHYRYVRIGELGHALPEMKNWQQPKPPEYHFPEEQFNGQLFLLPNKKEKFIVEVCPFRAWIPLLYPQDDYNLVTAYNLSLMAILVYAQRDESEHKIYSGSIEDFFFHQLLDLSKLPHKVNDQYFTLFAKDVPFSDCYNQLTFIDTVDGQFDTQMFFASNPKEVVCSWRGTASSVDVLTDAQGFRADTIDLLETDGEMHSGFKSAFMDASVHNPKHESRYYHTIEKLLSTRIAYVCGHSLGGALATIHAFFLSAKDLAIKGLYLYSYAMPRVFSFNTVIKFKFPHFRHVNNRDSVTSVPWQSLRKRISSPFEIMFSPMWETPLTLPSDWLEYFWHHGKLIHFTHVTNILPEIAEIEDVQNPGYPVFSVKDKHAKTTSLQNKYPDYPASKSQPKYRKTDLKILVSPSVVESKTKQTELYQTLINLYQRFGKDEKFDQTSFNPLDHPSGNYSSFLLLRLTALIDEKFNHEHPWLTKRNQFLNENSFVIKQSEGEALFTADLHLSHYKDTLLNTSEEYLEYEQRFVLSYHHPDYQQKLKKFIQADASEVGGRVQEALQTRRKYQQQMSEKVAEMAPWENVSGAVFDPELDRLVEQEKGYQKVLGKLKDML